MINTVRYELHYTEILLNCVNTDIYFIIHQYLFHFQYLLLVDFARREKLTYLSSIIIVINIAKTSKIIDVWPII